MVEEQYLSVHHNHCTLVINLPQDVLESSAQYNLFRKMTLTQHNNCRLLIRIILNTAFIYHRLVTQLF